MFELTPPHSDASGKAESDHYPTPNLLAQSGLEVARELNGGISNMLEPGCGERAPFVFSPMVQDVPRLGVEVRAGENTSTRLYGVNFLSCTDSTVLVHGRDRWDLIITNPPFSLATGFLDRAFELVADDGLVVMLLRLSIEGHSKARAGWFEAHPYLMRDVIHPRPHFTPKGTDNSEYAFFSWVSPAATKALIGAGEPMRLTRYLVCPSSNGWGRPEE